LSRSPSATPAEGASDRAPGGGRIAGAVPRYYDQTIDRLVAERPHETPANSPFPDTEAFSDGTSTHQGQLRPRIELTLHLAAI
jgi:hypothetical protein